MIHEASTLPCRSSRETLGLDNGRDRQTQALAVCRKTPLQQPSVTQEGVAASLCNVSAVASCMGPQGSNKGVTLHAYHAQAACWHKRIRGQNRSVASRLLRLYGLCARLTQFNAATAYTTQQSTAPRAYVKVTNAAGSLAPSTALFSCWISPYRWSNSWGRYSRASTVTLLVPTLYLSLAHLGARAGSSVTCRTTHK